MIPGLNSLDAKKVRISPYTIGDVENISITLSVTDQNGNTIDFKRIDQINDKSNFAGAQISVSPSTVRAYFDEIEILPVNMNYENSYTYFYSVRIQEAQN